MTYNYAYLKDTARKYSYEIFIFLFFIITYSLTMFPGPGGRINLGDSVKWQYLHAVNGLPHGTGYPQFLVISEIFSRVIFFLSVAERITFISVFFGTLSLVIFYSLLRLLTHNKMGSLIATFLLGFSYTFWAESTEAEVYTLNIFYLLSILYLFIRFYLTKKEIFYLAGCAIYALSFGNHLSMITVLPALVFMALATDRKTVLKSKNILLVVLFAFLGALQYGFIYYRAHTGSPLYKEIPFKPTFDQFLTYITGSDKSTMFAFTLKRVMYERIPVLFGFLNDNFTIVGILFAFAGFFYFLYVKKQRTISGFIALAILGQVTFHISYNVLDLFVFFLPVYTLLALCAGLLFAVHQDKIPRIGFALLVLYLFIFNIKTKDILLKETYKLSSFEPELSLYQEQKDNAPLYVKLGGNYYWQNFLNYLSAVELPPKSMFYELPSNPGDAFFVAHGPEEYPELVKDYDVSLVAELTLLDFVQKYNQPQQVIFISAMDEARNGLPSDFIDYFKASGSRIDTLPYRGSYAAVFYDGKLVESISGKHPVTLDSDSILNDPVNNELNYKVYSAGNNVGNESKIEIDNYDYSVKRRGLNLVVYSLKQDKVIQIVNFDTFLGKTWKLSKANKRNYVVPVGKIVQFKTLDGNYLSSNNGTRSVDASNGANKDQISFLIEDAGNGKIALKSMNKYLSSENGLSPMNCNRPGIGEWEKFDWIQNPDKTISLKGSNSLFVSLENNALFCTKSIMGNTEKFTAVLSQ